jgi:glycosyltransferase involved in cell wall biosynthesis
MIQDGVAGPPRPVGPPDRPTDRPTDLPHGNSRKKAIICEPSIWTLLNFRLNLIQALQAHGFEVVAAAPEYPNNDDFEKLGVRFVRFPGSQVGLNPFKGLWTIIFLWRLYRRERPDLVHQSTQKLVLYCSLAARLAGIGAIVNTVNGLGLMHGGASVKIRLVRFLVLGLSRFTLRRPVRMCFQNVYLRDFYLKRRLVRSDQAAIIPGSGADPERFFPMEPTGGADRPLRFLMFSRMIRDKGIEEYCRAAEMMLTERNPGRKVEFVLLGGARPNNTTGVHAEWIANPATISGDWLERESAKGYVQWRPHREDIIEEIQAADVVVLPSYYSEGIPRSLIEAMACGKAIVTTDTPGCRDVVETDLNGMLVAPRDVKALADAFAFIADRPGLEREMGEASRRLFLERFSDRQVVKLTLRQYALAGAPVFDEPASEIEVPDAMETVS